MNATTGSRPAAQEAREPAAGLLRRGGGTILDAIGNTPLIMVDGIWVKLEYLNPSGSIKARIARYMIERAEREGLLRPGDTIVEASSGNTGNAMSMVAAVKGYRMLVVMPDGMSGERLAISRAFGAQVMTLGDFHVNDALAKAAELGRQPGYFAPQQFDSEWNVEENRTWLGPETPGGSPPSNSTTCPTCTPSPAASAATSPPSPTASPWPTAAARSRATSAASKPSNARCSAAPASTSCERESCSAPKHHAESPIHDLCARANLASRQGPGVTGRPCPQAAAMPFASCTRRKAGLSRGQLTGPDSDGPRQTARSRCVARPETSAECRRHSTPGRSRRRRHARLAAAARRPGAGGLRRCRCSVPR